MYWNTHKSLIPLSIFFNTIVVAPLWSNAFQPNNDVFESWGETDLRINKFRYIWTINNFGSFSKNFDDVFSSPAFSYGTEANCLWNLEIAPKKSENNTNYVTLSLALMYSYACQRVSAQYKLGILNAKHKEINVISETNLFDYEHKKSYDHFIEKEYLLRQENGILVNNKLILFCEVNSTNKEETFGTSKQTSPNHELQKDLAVLLENDDFSDVTLSVQGTEFKSFKVILSARSPVFQDMFERNPNITHVEVVDLEPDVMNETLHYMYSDEVSNIQELAIDLLAAAEKYELSGLKILSEDALYANLTIQNAAELYILADLYSDNLKTKVRTYIKSHNSEVSQTDGFSSMMINHPNLFVELFNSL